MIYPVGRSTRAPGGRPLLQEEKKRSGRKETWRAPGWVVPILCAGAGYFVAGIPGAILAGVLGIGVWKARG